MIGPGIQDLRRSAAPDGTGRAARLEPGVIGDFDHCEGDWCRIEVADELRLAAALGDLGRGLPNE